MIYAIGRFLCRVFLYFFIRLSVKSLEGIPQRGGFIIAGNHASYLDPVIFGIACPRPLHFMARDTLFCNRAFAWLLRHVNAFPLKRHAADIGALKEALRRLKIGAGILLFPEGTRSQTGDIGRGLSGVGFLARKSGVCVIPAVVTGTDRAMPKGSKGIRPARVKVVFGKPLRFSREETDESVTAVVMERLRALKAEAFA